MNVPLTVMLALLGLALSISALRIAQRTHKQETAWCDLHEHISCTKAFTSSYAHVLGTENAWIGIGFYTLITLLAFTPYTILLTALALGAAAASIPLAYLSYVRMRNFCLVCTAIYLINFSLVFATWT